MTDWNAHLSLLLDLEARHDSLIDDLEALEKRVEQVLADCLGLRGPAEAA